MTAECRLSSAITKGLVFTVLARQHVVKHNLVSFNRDTITVRSLKSQRDSRVRQGRNYSLHLTWHTNRLQGDLIWEVAIPIDILGSDLEDVRFTRLEACQQESWEKSWFQQNVGISSVTVPI